MSKKPPSKLRAFSLIELSIVILIVSILLTGSLSFAINNATKDKIKITQDRIQEIYKAMGIYLAKNGKLPCPAPINVDKSTSTYGTAAATCTASGSGYWRSNTITNLYYGMIPTQTLNLPSSLAEDGFGNKFAYMTLTGFTDSTKFGYGSKSVATSTNYADNTNATVTINSITSPNRIQIKEKPASSAQVITTDAMFAIVSYGPNKSGGWSATSTAQNTVSTDADEMENDVDSPDATPTFDNVLIASSPNSDVFDDIVFWKTRDQMTLDFDLLNLVACDIDKSESLYGTTVNWNTTATTTNTRYGEVVPSVTACPSSPTDYRKGALYPTKRCGAFGVWENDMIDHCLQ